MRTDHYSPGPPPQQKNDWRVTDDLPKGMPITDAELDVVEAFLGAQLRAILNGCPQDAEMCASKGLKTCHNHGKLKHPVSRE